MASLAICLEQLSCLWAAAIDMPCYLIWAAATLQACISIYFWAAAISNVLWAEAVRRTCLAICFDQQLFDKSSCLLWAMASWQAMLSVLGSSNLTMSRKLIHLLLSSIFSSLAICFEQMLFDNPSYLLWAIAVCQVILLYSSNMPSCLTCQAICLEQQLYWQSYNDQKPFDKLSHLLWAATI